MRSLGERLTAAGVRVHGIRLAGHGGGPEELGDVTHANWYESVVEGFERLRAYDEPNVVIGLSMGAVLAARLAIDQREAVSAVVMLAPAFYLPFWTRTALRLLRPSINSPIGSTSISIAVRTFMTGPPAWFIQPIG